MELSIGITHDAPPQLFKAFSGPTANMIFKINVVEVLGVQDDHDRPAEFSVRTPHPLERVGELNAIVAKVDGVCRDGRPSDDIHGAVKALTEICSTLAHKALNEAGGGAAQIFCTVVLDKEIETPAGSGHYSTLVEGEATVVTSGE